MTGQEFAAALPTPLVWTAIALATLAFALWSLSSHGRCRDGWGSLALGLAVFCMVLALIVGWTTAGVAS